MLERRIADPDRCSVLRTNPRLWSPLGVGGHRILVPIRCDELQNVEMSASLDLRQWNLAGVWFARAESFPSGRVSCSDAKPAVPPQSFQPCAPELQSNARTFASRLSGMRSRRMHVSRQLRLPIFPPRERFLDRHPRSVSLGSETSVCASRAAVVWRFDSW